METGLTKREKTTDIFFDEAGAYITVCTHNTDLKKRLSAFAVTYPAECRLVARDRESGLLEFEVKKGAVILPPNGALLCRKKKKVEQ